MSRLENFKKKYPMFLSHLEELWCDSGWDDLLDNLFAVIEYQIKHVVDSDLKNEIYAVQIKEKFGSARIYCNKSTPFIEGAIGLASQISATTCEVCGNKGEIKKDFILKCVCKDHLDKIRRP